MVLLPSPAKVVKTRRMSSGVSHGVDGERVAETYTWAVLLPQPPILSHATGTAAVNDLFRVEIERMPTSGLVRLQAFSLQNRTVQRRMEQTDGPVPAPPQTGGSEGPTLELEHAIGYSTSCGTLCFHPNGKKYLCAAGASIIVCDFADPHDQVRLSANRAVGTVRYGVWGTRAPQARRRRRVSFEKYQVH
jgi:hypothetical protein